MRDLVAWALMTGDKVIFHDLILICDLAILANYFLENAGKYYGIDYSNGIKSSERRKWVENEIKGLLQLSPRHETPRRQRTARY